MNTLDEEMEASYRRAQAVNESWIYVFEPSEASDDADENKS
jgi:hypothetical protein